MTLQAVVGKLVKQEGKRDEITLARRVLARGEFLGSLRSWLHCRDDRGRDNRFRFSKVGIAWVGMGDRGWQYTILAGVFCRSSVE
jgi:hypothetical protein